MQTVLVPVRERTRLGLGDRDTRRTRLREAEARADQRLDRVQIGDAETYLQVARQESAE